MYVINTMLQKLFFKVLTKFWIYKKIKRIHIEYFFLPKDPSMKKISYTYSMYQYEKKYISRKQKITISTYLKK